MPYSRLYYHLVWTTKNRLPLLTPEIESAVHGYLVAKASGLGATLFALGGTEDHVHLVASIPPSVAVAKFVGQIKAVASTKLNQSGISEETFHWQAEYGAFTFDAKRLPSYVAYVRRQKQHHAEGTAIGVLERVADLTGRVAEQAATYATEDAAWRAELEECL